MPVNKFGVSSIAAAAIISSSTKSTINKIDGIPLGAFPATHYGTFDFIYDADPTDQVVPASNAGDYVFVVESSGGLGASDPDSKIHVYDVASNSSAPTGFSWSPPLSDVPDFKEANEIMINGNDMFIAYRWQNPDQSNTDPSKLVKFNNFSVDFSGSTITYDSVEIADLATKGCHALTRDDTYGYANYRGSVLDWGSFEPPLTKFNLSGPLTVANGTPVDGGLTVNSTPQEWYGNLYDGTFDYFDGQDQLGSNDLVCQGDYLYYPTYAMALNPNQIFSDSTVKAVLSICRSPVSNLLAPPEVLYCLDPSKTGLPGSSLSFTTMVCNGDYLYGFFARVTSRISLFSVNLTDPRINSLNVIGSTVMSSTNSGDNVGKAHNIELFGDKLIVTCQDSSFVGVYYQSDLSEVGHVFVGELDSSLIGIGMTDDLAVYGNYAYLPFEGYAAPGTANKLYSLDLTNISTSGLTLVDTYTNLPFGATNSSMVV